MAELNNNTQTNNRRIAKNTLMLYFRMFLMMAISLYTSRVILRVLGVEDYGIYTVVGGLVSMFGLLSGSLSSATSRYITVALGKGDKQYLNKVFSISLQNHAFIAVITCILIETLGVYFLYNKMQIPAERVSAAFWVLQLSVVAFIVSIFNMPYNADIVAHERMSAFAYISIIEAFLKLGIVFILAITPFDRLIVYAGLLVAVQVSIQFMYIIYCHRHFEESHYHYYKDFPLLREMLAFACWNLFGGMSSIAFGQGLSMLLNVFFGPVVNAARGIAQQVQSAIQVFITNFQMALNPQIVKNYATEDFDQMHLLMERSSRFSFFLMLMLSLPVMFEAPYILQLWLGVVPNNTAIFLRLIIATTLLYTIINPILTANNATGEVRKYYTVCGCLMISILPISYIVLRLGAPAYAVFIVHFCVEAFTQVVRLFLVRGRLRLSVRQYVKRVYLPIMVVTVVSCVVPFFVWLKLGEGLVPFLVVSAISILSVAIVSFTIGFTSNERNFIISKIKPVLNRVK